LNFIDILSSGGSWPLGIAYSPDGDCIAVANTTSNNISVYSVKNDYKITFLKSYPVINQPYFPVFSPNGQCLAVSNGSAYSNGVSMFSVKDCNLTPIDITVNGLLPINIAYSPNGKCLAAINYANNSNSIEILAAI
jgi:DNA-binding beta-propeller fold protein YncE